MDRKSFMKAAGIGIVAIPTITKDHFITSRRAPASKFAPKIMRDDDGKVLNVIGDIQKHKLVGSDTGNQITEWVDDVDPGVGIPPHVHTKEDEIFRVIKGQVEIMVGEETTVLKEGDMAFAPKNVVHAWKVVGTEKAKMCTSAFPAGIEKMFTELSEMPAGPPDFGKVSEICGKYGISFV